MANFPTPGSVNSFTGFINGFNVVSCPQECQLVQNSPIYNKNDYSSHNNVYNMDDIRGYYCAVNNGPPVPHTTRPEGYNTVYAYITSNNWSNGFESEEVTEDEVYTTPRTDFLYSAFNATPTCVNSLPPTNSPAPPSDPENCANPQASLTWFRLNPNMFK